MEDLQENSDVDNHHEYEHDELDDNQAIDPEVVYELTSQLAHADRHCCFSKRRGVAGRNTSQDNFPIFKQAQIRWFSIIWSGPTSEWRIIYDKEPILDASNHLSAGADKSIYIRDITDVAVEPHQMKGFRIYRGKEVIQLISVIESKARETSENWTDAIRAAMELIQCSDDITYNLREKWFATVDDDQDDKDGDADEDNNNNDEDETQQHQAMAEKALPSEVDDDHGRAETITLSSTQTSAHDMMRMPELNTSPSSYDSHDNNDENDNEDDHDHHMSASHLQSNRTPPKSSYRNFAKSLLGMMYSPRHKEQRDHHNHSFDTSSIKMPISRSPDRYHHQSDSDHDDVNHDDHNHMQSHDTPSKRPLKGILRQNSINTISDTRNAALHNINKSDAASNTTPESKPMTSLEKWKSETEGLSYDYDITSSYNHPIPVIQQLLRSQQIVQEKISYERSYDNISSMDHHYIRSDGYTGSSRHRIRDGNAYTISTISVNTRSRNHIISQPSSPLSSTMSSPSAAVSVIVAVDNQANDPMMLIVELLNIQQQLICILDIDHHCISIQRHNPSEHQHDHDHIHITIPLSQILAAECAGGSYAGLFKLFIIKSDLIVDSIGIFPSSNDAWRGWLVFRAVNPMLLTAWIDVLKTHCHRIANR